jgi:phosphate transport system ATP-binding protein
MTPEEPILVTIDPMQSSWNASGAPGSRPEVELASFPGAVVVQVVSGDAHRPDAMIAELHSATVTVTDVRILAKDGDIAWAWLVTDIAAVVHGADEPWTIFDVPGISDFGVSVPPGKAEEFRAVLDRIPGLEVRYQQRIGDGSGTAVGGSPLPPPDPSTGPVPVIVAAAAAAAPLMSESLAELGGADPSVTTEMDLVDADPAHAASDPAASGERRFRLRNREHGSSLMAGPTSLAGLDARNISAWFGSHLVLDRVSLHMEAGKVTALIGPSGCGKSTFLRILNRMHEMIPSAALAGEVLLDGHDVYDPERKLTDARREIGMVFQKPNPFPAMSIYDNVLASLRLTGVKASVQVKDELVESCLSKAGLWNEVRDRLRQPGGGLSGGQQQRLCIARALAIRPRVLLMDEPCSALDPTSTRRIEETIMELVSEVTIVIVTHNMQQAARVSNHCAFFLASQGTPGIIVEHGPTDAMFGSPQDQRTLDYVTGRFG